jgi:hypothetical protein
VGDLSLVELACDPELVTFTRDELCRKAALAEYLAARGPTQGAELCADLEWPADRF